MTNPYEYVMRTEMPPTRRKLAYEPVEIKAEKKNLLTSGLLLEKVRSAAYDLPDDTRIGDLRIPPEAMKKSYYIPYGYIEDCTPPRAWKEFYTKLPHGERKSLSGVFNKAMESGFETVGIIRKASREQLRTPKTLKGMQRISENGLNFLTRAFQPLPYEGVLVKKGEWVVFR